MRIKKKSENVKLIKLFFQSENNSEQVTFAQICKFIRECFNLTQIEMAEMLRVTGSAYRYWEAGTREPSSKAAFNLCLMYLQAIEFRKIKDNLHKSDLLPQFDTNNPFDEITVPLDHTENDSVNAA